MEKRKRPETGWVVVVVDSSWFDCIIAVGNDHRLILTCERGVIAITDCTEAGPSTTHAILLPVLYARQK